MKRNTCALILPMILFMTLSCVQASGYSFPNSFFDKWVITKIIPTTNVQALSPEEAKQMLGKEMLLSSDLAMFDGSTCPKPRYVAERKSEDEFLTARRIPLAQLGIETEFIEEIFIYQGDRLWLSSGDLYVKDADTLITNQEGVYFEMKRKNGSGKK